LSVHAECVDIFVDKYSIYAIFVFKVSMEFLFYPDPVIIKSSQEVLTSRPAGAVRKEIDDLSKKHKDLYTLVKDFLEKLLKSSDLSVYYRIEWLYDLGDGLHEMRIPKTRRGGVFRIYFGYARNRPDVLVLFDAELKHKPEPDRISSARKKLQDYERRMMEGEKK
jgi:hypothetical protein